MPRPVPPRALASALTLSALVGAVLAFAPPASASPLPTPALSKSTVRPGEYFTISGSGCVDPTPGADLPGVGVSGPEFGDGEQVHPDGTWSLNDAFGQDLPPGSYTLQATCMRSDGNVLYPPVTVTVSGPSTLQPPPEVAPGPAPVPGAHTPVTTTAPRTTAPRTTAPRSTSATTSSSSTSATTTATSTTPATTSATAATGSFSTATAPTPAADCRDCARLTDDAPLVPGQGLTLRYAGFQPGEQVTLVMHSTPVTLGTFTADASGVVSVTVTIPASAEAGSHTLILSGAQSGDRALGFRLAADARDRPAATPAKAGSSLALPLAVGGAVLVVAAAGGVLGLRRRRVGRALGNG